MFRWLGEKGDAKNGAGMEGRQPAQQFFLEITFDFLRSSPKVTTFKLFRSLELNILHKYDYVITAFELIYARSAQYCRFYFLMYIF